MTEKPLGVIESVNPRVIWPNEAGNFTPWLSEHIDLLGVELGLDIEIDQVEAAVGAFSLDLLGKESGSGRIVIIENQLERTDHTHLGQLLAYAAGYDARIIVWISPDIRDEHREAVHWFNERTTDEVAMFAVEVEVLKIGNSLPAPRFNVVARPSRFQRELPDGRAAPSARGVAYQRFFRELVNQLHIQKPGFTRAIPDLIRHDSWVGFGSGRSGFSILAAFASGNRFRVELTINTRTGDSARNKFAFDALKANRESIESQLGQTLEWERLDDSVTSRIAAYKQGDVEAEPDELAELRNWAIELLPRFRDAFTAHIKAIDFDIQASVALTEGE